MTIPTNNDSITLYETLMPKLLKPTCRKLYVYLHVKNQLHISLLFWDITKTLQSCYFENFGNDWPSPSKIILSICRTLSCLSACKKSTSSFTAFLRYWCQNINYNIIFHFWSYPGKTKDKIFQKIQKNLFWDYFGPFFSRFGQKWIFLEKRALSVF